MNRSIKRYPAFADFYGMEETIERIVGFFKHAAQGSRSASRSSICLARSAAASRRSPSGLKSLMEKLPIYVLKAGDQVSPVFRIAARPVRRRAHGAGAAGEVQHPRAAICTGLISPWAVKRIAEFDGDISKFTVVKLYPSKLKQIGVAKAEPGDDNNQDISTLVGKVDIRKLEFFSQNDPDAYSLQRRPQPDDPGPAGVRRDVQGADQDAAPAADRDPGVQLRRHRERRRDPLPGHRAGPLERGRMADLQEQQEQRGLHRPRLRGEGAVLPALQRGDARSTGSCCSRATSRRRPARRRRWTCCRSSASSRA